MLSEIVVKLMKKEGIRKFRHVPDFKILFSKILTIKAVVCCGHIWS